MCSVAQTAAAFKENGHRAIEAAAYARLIESHQASSLAALLRAGILDGHLPETNAQIVKGGTVVAREVATVVSKADIGAIAKGDTPPAPGTAKIEMLKGNDYIRVWVNKDGTNYLLHLPVSA